MDPGPSRRQFLRAAGASLAGIGLSQKVWAQRQDRTRPNIVLILADDMGRLDRMRAMRIIRKDWAIREGR